MADDRKRDNKIVLRCTDRELLDLSRNAVREERTLAEYVHVVVRRNLYGTIGSGRADGNDDRSDYQPPRDPLE